MFEQFVTATEVYRRKSELEVDIYGRLVNCISNKVFSFIEDTNNYEAVLELLKEALIWPKNTEMQGWAIFFDCGSKSFFYLAGGLDKRENAICYNDFLGFI